MRNDEGKEELTKKSWSHFSDVAYIVLKNLTNCTRVTACKKIKNGPPIPFFDPCPSVGAIRRAEQSRAVQKWPLDQPCSSPYLIASLRSVTIPPPEAWLRTQWAQLGRVGSVTAKRHWIWSPTPTPSRWADSLAVMASWTSLGKTYRLFTFLFSPLLSVWLPRKLNTKKQKKISRTAELKLSK